MSVQFGKKARDHEWGFTELSGSRFHAGNATGVLICHGFGCTPSTMSCLIDRATELGFTVAVPLLTGHARTFRELNASGFRDWRNDVWEAYKKLADSGCTRIFLCGLSLGALLMADLASRLEDDERLSGVFLICPPIRMKTYLNICSDIADLIPYVKTADGFQEDGIEMYFGMASRKLRDIRRMASLAKKGAGKIKAPVMLIQAENDNRVAPSTYRILLKRLPNATHIIMKNAPHGIPYSDKRDKLADMFEGFLSPEGR